MSVDYMKFNMLQRAVYTVFFIIRSSFSTVDSIARLVTLARRNRRSALCCSST